MRKNKKLSSHCHASILMMILFTQHWSEHICQCCYELHCLHRLVFLKCLFIKITFSPFLSHKVGTSSRTDNKICTPYRAMCTDSTVSIIKMRNILPHLQSRSGSQRWCFLTWYMLSKLCNANLILTENFYLNCLWRSSLKRIPKTHAAFQFHLLQVILQFTYRIL